MQSYSIQYESIPSIDLLFVSLAISSIARACPFKNGFSTIHHSPHAQQTGTDELKRLYPASSILDEQSLHAALDSSGRMSKA